ncbi:MAG: hypothetical protein AABX07_03290 [Nanoarchaeota archaeon]
MIAQRLEDSRDEQRGHLRILDVSPANPDRVAEAIIESLEACNSSNRSGLPAGVVGLNFYCQPDGEVTKVEVSYMVKGRIQTGFLFENKFYSAP